MGRRCGAPMEVLRGCRQLAAGGVGVSAITSATPLFSCHQVKLGTLETLPPQGVRTVGMTSNQHGPYVRGDTRVTMAENRGEPRGDTEPIPKIRLSSDWSLQPDSMKLDSLVIAHQPWRGEYVPGPCTHRPSSHGSLECLKSVTARSGQG